MNPLQTYQPISPKDFFEEYERTRPERERVRQEKLKSIESRFERWLIKKLTNQNGCIDIKDINVKFRTVHLGWFGISLHLMEPNQKFYLQLLVRFYKYTCYTREFKKPEVL